MAANAAPKRQRNRAADHAGGGDEAGFFGDDVHRAALAAAVAGGAPGDLRHEPVDIRAFGDGMAVGAMAAVNEVVCAQQTANADGDGFLADAQMQQADDLPLGVERGGFFFERADEPHAAQEVDEV